MSGQKAAFYFDLASPLAYLVAERILHELGGPVEWQPVLAARVAQHDAAWRAHIERRVRELGLQPLRWPGEFPFDSTFAMRVATYAKSIGRAVPFAQAAFRQAFAGGRSLGDPDNVLIAAAACEMHPTAILRAAELRSVVDQLAAATAAAAQAGAREVPAIALGDKLFAGEHALEQAVAHRTTAPCQDRHAQQ